MPNIFGFSTEPSSGDFLPIIKYDARGGRFFRVDRGVDGKEPVDITDSFAAVFDLENVEVGWMNFSGPQPDFKLVPMGSPLPVRPSENHKNGVRVLLKLHPSCAGTEKPIREFSTTAKAALNGIEKLYMAYSQGKPANGKLPIVAMRGSTPVKTGAGDRQSTNYVPKLEIVGWANRPSDLVFIARGSSGPSQNALPLTQPHPTAGQPNGNGAFAGKPVPAWAGQTPPHTGSTLSPPPVRQALANAPENQGWPEETPAVGQPVRVAPQQPANLADDFG